MSGNTRYSHQRDKRTPPHVSLRSLRNAVGWTADQLIARMREEDPRLILNRGTISAIESGTRGASPHMLEVLCAAYGLPSGAIVTDYEPVTRRAA